MNETDQELNKELREKSEELRDEGTSSESGVSEETSSVNAADKEFKDEGTPSGAAAPPPAEREAKEIDDRGSVSRRQFLAGGVGGFVGAILGIVSEKFIESKWGNRAENEETGVESRETEENWERLPMDVLTGAYLVCDPESGLFGGTRQNKDGLLTQYVHVYPGLEVLLSRPGENDEMYGWVCYNKELSPVMAIRSSGIEIEEGETSVVYTIPEDAYYLRGSCGNPEAPPSIQVRNLAEYLFRCGISKPDLSSYTEIDDLTVYPHTRREEDSRLEEKTSVSPAVGDVFFTPIGSDIVVTFRNANIVPVLHCGENFKMLNGKTQFSRCFGFGYAWYHCKTTEVCNWLEVCYETINGCAKTLTPEELRDADPHLYIRFPSRATQTREAARIRTEGLWDNHERLFTVVHLTDIHGDMDSAHAAYEYADQIGADFVALTGDYVPYCAEHGCNTLHSMIRKAKTPTVYTLGNHDVNEYSDQQVYEAGIAPIRDVLQASKEHPYYYRDFLSREGEVIRVISLYPFYDKAKSRWRGFYTQKQLQWLCNMMATVPDGGHIFILRHFSHHKPVYLDNGQMGQTMFYDNPHKIGEDWDLWLNMDKDPVTVIVDAYNRKEKLSYEFTGELEGEKTESIKVEHDFTNRPNSEFVAYFTGHVHVDAVGYTRNTRTQQAVLCSICTTGVKGTEEYHSFSGIRSLRDYGTDSQIAFNVFTFNFWERKIFVARVGNGSFGDQEKTRMELTY